MNRHVLLRRISKAGFFAPAGIMIASIILLPIAYSIWLGFNDWTGFGTPTWTGLGNYARLVRDEVFLEALGNNFFIMVVGVSGIVLIGLMVSLVVNRGLPEGGLLRAVVFLPAVIPMIIVSLIWSRVFAGHYGLLNELLKALGLESLTKFWLTDTTTALPTVTTVWIWKHFGYTSVMLLAALQGIPSTYYEAARIEGADEFAIDRYITIPLLRSTIVVVTLWGIILAFKVFALVFAMTGGGPYYKTEVINTYLYRIAFMQGDIGLASASATVVLLILLVFGVVRRFFNKTIEY